MEACKGGIRRHHYHHQSSRRRCVRCMHCGSQRYILCTYLSNITAASRLSRLCVLHSAAAAAAAAAVQNLVRETPDATHFELLGAGRQDRILTPAAPRIVEHSGGGPPSPFVPVITRFFLQLGRGEEMQEVRAVGRSRWLSKIAATKLDLSQTGTGKVGRARSTIDCKAADAGHCPAQAHQAALCGPCPGARCCNGPPSAQ